MISIKAPAEIAAMREGGKILAEILHELALATKPGISTGELNLKAEALMEARSVAPSFKGYHGYPAVICTAINEEVVHSIPGKRIIAAGDIISIDCGVIHKGFHTDSAVTVLVGAVSDEARNFVLCVQKAFEKGLIEAVAGNRIGDISFAVQRWIESNGYAVVRDFVGHGIGREMHEEPQIPNFGKKGKGPLLVPGMTIAIEPIIAQGARYVDILRDEWTAVTRDGSLGCQIEHTLLITAGAPEVLTKYDGNINNVYPQ